MKELGDSLMRDTENLASLPDRELGFLDELAGGSGDGCRSFMLKVVGFAADPYGFINVGLDRCG